MDTQLYGYLLYAISLLTMGGIYSVLTLGLNIQWGFTGLFNAGIAGFFAIGAYASAILTAPLDELSYGPIGTPLFVGAVAAMIVSAIVAWAIGRICIRLRSDYLAIATIGIGEILRLALKNEGWLINGPRGISKVPRAFESWPELQAKVAFMVMILLIVAVIYLLLERARTSPWGRVMTAIRENEAAARAAGKNVERFRVEAFVMGASLMGLAGALMAQNLKFIDPTATDPLLATFLVWVMLIAGGSANNRGAILGAMLIWVLWSATELVAAPALESVAGWLTRNGIIDLSNIADLQVRSAYLRIFLIGLVLQYVLQKYPQGILPESRPAAVRPIKT